jgi:hypothetical protein
MMMRLGKRIEAEKFLNNALAVDPSNWQALWAKYKLAQDEDKKREEELTASQLAYYYPKLPEVLAIVKNLDKSSH